MITKRQKEALNFIESYKKKNGYSPSLEEIKKHLHLTSVSTAHHHVKKLQEAGFLSKEEHQPRAIEISEAGPMVEINIIGTIAAGQPIEAIDDAQNSVLVARNEISKFGDHYALKVKGNSMMDDGIFNGDIVVIKKQSVADNGQTVVAIIDDNEATLKKIYREKGRYRLQPANQTMLPIYTKEVEVRGVVVKIIRNFNDQNQTSQGFRTIDLFAGVGGIRLGFENAGFKTVFANDFEEQCRVTYDLNFKSEKLTVEDIRKIGIDDLPEFDFLLAGFPCQAFSIAGYRQGFNDKKDRGNLFFDMAKIIEARRPTGFLLENVKNLKNHDGGKTFEIIKETLEKLGYHIKVAVLNAMEYGNVPQNRERIYIVGFKNEKHYENFSFPNKQKLTVRITDLLEKNVPEKYYYNGKPLYEKIKDEVTEIGKVYQWRRKYVRKNKKGVCPTLTANMGMGGHNVPIIKDHGGIRKLTPKECASIQGFPKNFKIPTELADSYLYKQFGNSVCVPVICAIANQIKKAMS